MAFKVPTAIVTGVVVLSGLAIGSAIDKSMPTTSDLLLKPFTHEAAVGEAVSMRTSDLAVTRVRTSTSIVSAFETLKTDYVFVVLDIAYAAKNQPSGPTHIVYRSGGKEYSAAHETWGTCSDGQPGVPQSCQVAIEVDPADLPGMTVEIATSKHSDIGGDDLAVIDLGIGTDSALVTSPEVSIEVNRISYDSAGN